MKILIVNIGALGACVRTSSLLRLFGEDDEVYWLTKKISSVFLKSSRIDGFYFIDDEESLNEIYDEYFDFIVVIDEEKEVLEVVNKLSYGKIIGAFLDEDGELNYTKESKKWFDMSVNGKLGKEKADELKIKNKKSFQQIWIEICGGVWRGQEYDLGLEMKKGVEGRIGLIDVNTGAWPNKNWKYWGELKEKLEDGGYEVVSLGERETLIEHIDDINNCECVVCPDTFGMHVALALKKKVVAIFNCTPPNEIYDYGRMKKVVSPLLSRYFFKKSYDEEAVSAVKVDEVYVAVKEMMKDE